MEPEHRHNDEVILAELKALKELHSLRISQNEITIAELKKMGDEFHKRINIIELWQANSLGKLTIISVAIGVGISVLVGWISGKL